jgi:hypothetical protein
VLVFDAAAKIAAAVRESARFGATGPRRALVAALLAEGLAEDVFAAVNVLVPREHDR